MQEWTEINIGNRFTLPEPFTLIHLNTTFGKQDQLGYMDARNHFYIGVRIPTPKEWRKL